MRDYSTRKHVGFKIIHQPDEPRREAKRRATRLIREFLFAHLERTVSDRPIFAVQVGANDGKLADPLIAQFERHGWHGLLLEPNPVYYSRLEKRHEAREHVQVRNLGCSDHPARMTLFYLDPAHEHLYRENARGCASLDEERMIGALASQRPKDEARKHVAKVDVELVPLRDILAREAVGKADVLVIDVEGHEPNVIAGADLAQMMPSIAIVEINTPETKAKTIAPFQALGYITLKQQDDMIALSPDLQGVEVVADFLSFMGAFNL